ncbi:MAG: hypothetical protein EA425_00650 [Puniceicoccaceae bacterium]|nr:MAG: hypothetical protein EA425_00650 [Puniceicoccaceae bacterium]
MVAVTSPTNGSTFTLGETVTVHALTYGDTSTLTKVEFFRGSTKIGERTSSPWSVSWAPSSAGNYSLTARTTNSAGITHTSTPVSISVQVAPLTIAWDAPANNASFTYGQSVVFKATPSDPSRVSRIDYLADGAVVASSTTAPFEASWTPETPGTYTVTARLTETGTGQTVSTNNRTITVPAPSPLTVSILSPAVDAGHSEGELIRLEAEVGPSERVLAVTFRLNGQLLAAFDSAPYLLEVPFEEPGDYTFEVIAEGDWPEDRGSASISFEVVPVLSQPEPQLAGIGSTNPAGGAEIDDEDRHLIIHGSGSGLGHDGDNIEFVFEERPEPTEISARLFGLTNTDAGAQGGLMFRRSTDPHAAYVAVVRESQNRIVFLRRSVANGPTERTERTTATGPVWMKLVPEGADTLAYFSPNGRQWIFLGRTAFDARAFHLAGAAVSSGTAPLALGVFDHVRIPTIEAQIPVTGEPVTEIFQAKDVGEVTLAGSTEHDTETDRFTIRAAGSQIWGTADAFRFVHRSLEGDGSIVARMASLEATHAWAKAGIMIRASDAPDAPHVFIGFEPIPGIAIIHREVQGGLSEKREIPINGSSRWFKLVREGNTFTAYAGGNGLTWEELASFEIDLPHAARAGLAVTSQVPNHLTTAVFEEVVIEQAPPPLQ